MSTATLDATDRAGAMGVAHQRPVYVLTDVARLLDAPPQTVRRWAREHRIPAPARKVGDQMYWPVAAFDAWLIGDQT